MKDFGRSVDRMSADVQHTFLFADLAGYTALTETHGDETAADLVGEFCVKNVAEQVDLYRAGEGAEDEAELPIDPVCRMAVDPEHSAGRLVHAGVEYRFCSLECAGKFAAAPERFIRRRSQSSS
jgi:YHS domain-containing protein